MSGDIKNSIITWIQSQPLWVQKACEKILKKSEISEQVINELLTLLKTDEGNKTGKLIDFSFFLSTAEESQVVSLKNIGDIHGIDDLSPRTPLEFGKGLSIVYGNNGSGKSGYTRILKKITGKPDAVDLISNVFKPEPAKRSCKITYTLADNTDSTTVEWVANTNPISALQSIDIFDATSGGTYLEKETDATYIPIEVALFDSLVQVFLKLKTKLEDDERALVCKLPARPVDFGNAKFIEWMYLIKSSSDGEKLKSTFLFTEVDDKALLSLEEKIKIAPSSLAQSKQQKINQIIHLLDSLKSSSDLVSQKNCDEIERLRATTEVKKKATLDAAQALKKDSKFDGIGESSWKSLWIAAQKYSEDLAYKGVAFPNIGEESHCVLCHQELSINAKSRLANFSEYIKGQLQTELAAAEKAYTDSLDKLPKIQSEHEIKTSITACQLDEGKWLPILKDIWKKMEDVKTKLLKKDGIRVTGYSYEPEGLKEIINLRDSLKKEIDSHIEDAKSFDVEKVKSDLNELKAKKWASSYITVMIDEIERLKKIEKIKGWIKLVGTKGVSTKGGEISEGLLTEEYVKRFNTELKLLGAERISVELVKSRMDKGRPKHKLQLKNLNQPSTKIQLKPLSDGEKRIISLAAFLADVTARKNKSSFVFDDPISSLDQVYEEKTAQRLIDLSKERQVIVFTHRLSLLGLLSTKDAISLHIRRESWGCGEHGGLPLFAQNPMGAVNKLMNERLAQAKKALKNDGTEIYNIHAKSICSEFRILIERIIEQELLGGIVLRHQRKLTTNKKLNILTKIKKEDCDLLEGLMSEFSVYEHSQSAEAPAEPPAPEALELSLKKVIDWNEEFSKRALT